MAQIGAKKHKVVGELAVNCKRLEEDGQHTLDSVGCGDNRQISADKEEAAREATKKLAKVQKNTRHQVVALR